MRELKSKDFSKYWKEISEIEERYYSDVMRVERKMKKEMGDMELEFVWKDGEVCGAGNIDNSIKIIHREY